MALVGLVRVSTKAQETTRQHDALEPICVKVFEERVSGKLRAEDRPGLTAALGYLRDGDMLTVQEVDRLGRNLLEGLIVLTELFQRGIAVKVLEGIAAGEHTERSLILDLALALAEDRRRDIARKTKDGLDAARNRGRLGGRPSVVDDDKRRAILARRGEGESLRTIATGVGVSLPVVHRVVTQYDHQSDQGAVLVAERESVVVADPLPKSPGRFDCPTCSYRPTSNHQVAQHREELDTIWLFADPAAPESLVERRHCSRCQPHRVEIIMCQLCGISVMLGGDLAGQVAGRELPELARRWLTDHSWVPHASGWKCGQHPVRQPPLPRT